MQPAAERGDAARLYRAVSEQDVDLVKQLCSEPCLGDLLKYKDERGLTPLLGAVVRRGEGQTCACGMCAAPPKPSFPIGLLTCLHLQAWACDGCGVEVLSLLLDALDGMGQQGRAHLAASTDWQGTVLHVSAFYWTRLTARQTEVGQRLIPAAVAAGIDLDSRDYEGLAALHIAACCPGCEFAKLLINAGAPVK